MELELKKTPIHYLDAVVNNLQDREETQELKLSDALPDIGRMITSFGQIIVRSKQWMTDALLVSGGVMAFVMYATEDGSDICCVDTWIPFQFRWQIPEESDEGEIVVDTILRSIDARSVSPRKIMLRAGISAQVLALTQKHTDAYSGNEISEDVETLIESYSVRLMREAGEKTFSIDEDVQLPSDCSDAEKLLSYNVEPIVTEQKVMGNKVVFRGSANLHLLFARNDGRLGSCELSLPFSQFAQADGEFTPDAAAEVIVCITDLDIEIANEQMLHAKVGLAAQYMINDLQNLTLTRDAYAIRREIRANIEPLVLPARLTDCSQEVTQEQSVNANAQSIVHSVLYPDFPRVRRTDEQLRMDLTSQMRVLYYDSDGALNCANARAESSVTPNVDAESALLHCRFVGSNMQVSVGNGAISIRAQTQIECAFENRNAIQMVTSIEMGETVAPDPSRPSVILRRANGERLWEIAKKCDATVADIRDANALKEEPASGQMLLIPVR